MIKVYVNFDEENFINIFSYNDDSLTEAYMEDDFKPSFGFTKVRKDSDGKYYLYNSEITKELYIQKDTSYEDKLMNEIDDYKHKLTETDYVVVKIAESQAFGEDTSSLLEEYSEVLTNRKEYRKKINELQEELNKINN